MIQNNAPVAQLIGKKKEEFTLSDIVEFVLGNDIQMVNFMYPAGDGRLKTLNFVTGSREHLETILAYGERVDGSSLFPFIEAGSSDLYVVPRLSTAFIDPFASLDTLCFLCSFFDNTGSRLESSPEYVLHKAKKAFEEKTGMEYQAMGELEYYVSAPEEDYPLYPSADQRGYHESAPFAKFNEFRMECMNCIAMAGGDIKYGHSEVGNFRLDGRIYEQQEIEFLPVDVEKAADTLMIAKWIIRNLASSYGLDTSFAPKITVGKAGSGLHIHMRIMKDGANMMVDRTTGKLSDIARRAIAGMMELAPSITAFGNVNPCSYFRLVPHQEAPTSVCWGDRNRSVLVRVPLGWNSGRDMFSQINPAASGVSDEIAREAADRQTVELRSADCSANIYQLLAALCVACRHGLEMEDGLELAGRTYVDVNIHKTENAALLESLKELPASCSASADCLDAQRAVYEAEGIFSESMIDSIIAGLKGFGDAQLRDETARRPELLKELVEKYFYCG